MMILTSFFVSVKFVEGIQHNKFAYTIGGSVYFDVKAFEAAGNTYAVSLSHFASSSKKGALIPKSFSDLSRGVDRMPSS